MIVKSCLCAPADVEGGVNVGRAPFHNLTKLVPIFDLLEGEKLNGCARDYHTVKIAVLYLVKGLVETDKVILRHVFRFVGGGPDKLHLYLKRSVSEKSGELCLGLDLLGHKI